MPEPTPEPYFALEPKSNIMSDRVCSVPVDFILEFEGMNWSPAHTPVAEGELCKVSVELYEDLEEKAPSL